MNKNISFHLPLLAKLLDKHPLHPRLITKAGNIGLSITAHNSYTFREEENGYTMVETARTGDVDVLLWGWLQMPRLEIDVYWETTTPWLVSILSKIGTHEMFRPEPLMGDNGIRISCGEEGVCSDSDGGPLLPSYHVSLWFSKWDVTLPF